MFVPRRDSLRGSAPGHAEERHGLAQRVGGVVEPLTLAERVRYTLVAADARLNAVPLEPPPELLPLVAQRIELRFHRRGAVTEPG